MDRPTSAVHHTISKLLTKIQNKPIADQIIMRVINFSDITARAAAPKYIVAVGKYRTVLDYRNIVKVWK